MVYDAHPARLYQVYGARCAPYLLSQKKLNQSNLAPLIMVAIDGLCLLAFPAMLHFLNTRKNII